MQGFVSGRYWCAVSALALMVGWGGQAWAMPVAAHEIVGMSRDGSVYLDRQMAYENNDYVVTYRLVSTANGTSVTIEFPPGANNPYIAGMSPDGSVLAGVSYTDGGPQAFIWNNGQLTFSSALSSFLNVAGVSNNGIVAGTQFDPSSSNALIWQDGRFTPAPHDGPVTSTSAAAISLDGSTVVGEVTSSGDNGHYHAMVWKLADQSVFNIDTLYDRSSAEFVSRDGSVVAGEGTHFGQDDQDEYRVFRWSMLGGMRDIGTLGDSGQYMSLSAMSDDGSVLVGTGGVQSGADHAYRYVAPAQPNGTGELTDLGTLGGQSSYARNVSADGRYVVGYAQNAENVDRGFRWSEATGMQSIEQWLAAANVTYNYATVDAEFISDDGNVVTGLTDEGNIYVARVGAVSGIIDEAKFFPTVVQAASTSVQNNVGNANTIMFGAQGNPMRNLLSEGQRSVWGTVDGGYDNSDLSEGGLALGEFGFGYGIAEGVTARFSVGGTYSNQDLDAGGSVRQRGYYLSPEVSTHLGSDVYLTLGGYLGRSSIDTARGYLNGSSQDYSNGSTHADTWGAKIRFDWLNAANIGATDITPYAGLSYARTKVDGYTETGGSFPVSYDETKDHSTVLRIGADFVHPLTDTVRLLAKAEADYQFEKHAATTSGTLIGLNDFSIAGQDLKQFWVRGGLGAEFDAGGGTASLMVNATTEGQDATVWVRANYTVKF
ncbi:Autotransporter beta-domain-containing protein [Rhizobium sp. RU35A]|nr:Autotransporter beta-domain-containing protein [Rhizobium sp. RU35A]